LLDRLEKFIDGGRYDEAEELGTSLYQQMRKSEFFQQNNLQFHQDFDRLELLKARLFREQSASARRQRDENIRTKMQSTEQGADLNVSGKNSSGGSTDGAVVQPAMKNKAKSANIVPTIAVWSPEERCSMFRLAFTKFPKLVCWCFAAIYFDVPGVVKIPSVQEKSRWERFVGGLPKYVNPDFVYDSLFLDDSFRDYGVWEMLSSEYALRLVTVGWQPIRTTLKAALVNLTNVRILDRSRLLDLCVFGATRWTDELRVDWISALHDELNPAGEERKRYLDQYISGLHSNVANCARWSLAQVTLAYSLKLIDTASIEPYISAVLTHPYGAIIDGCINLLKLIAKQDKNAHGLIVQTALRILDAAADSAQRKYAVDFIEKYGDPHDLLFAKALHKRLEKLDGPQQHKLRLWLDAGAYGEHLRAASAAKLSADVNEVEDMLGQIESCDGDLLLLADIQTAAAFARGESDSAPALDLYRENVPRLCHDHAIEPITNINDLIYAFIRVLDRKTTGDEIERVLDGMSRLCDDRPFDFKTRVGRLKDRALQRLQPEQFQDSTELRLTQPFGGVSHQEDLAGLALVWTDGNNLSAYNKVCPRLEALLFQNTSLSRHVMNGRSLQSFFSARVLPIALRVLQKKSAPLLSAPTHKGGWIDPRVMPGRLSEFAKLKIEPDQFDVAQALLRLAPDYKQEALQMLSGLDGEIAAAFRYALGGELAEQTTKPWLWAMAARARSPEEDDEVLCGRFSKMQSDTIRSVIYDLNYAKPQLTIGVTSVFMGTYLLPQDYLPARDESVTMPTALFHCKPYSMFQLQFMSKRVWEPLVWPQYRESYFAGEARQVLAHIDSQGKYWLDAWEPAFDIDTHTKGMARFLIVFGLAAKREECVKQAIEVLILAIEDGRLDGESLGDAFATTMFSRHLVISRWMIALDEVAIVSPLHKIAVKRTLEHALVGVSPMGSPPPKLLPRLYELATECGEGIIFEQARARLRGMSLKGVAAKTAKALLDLGSIDSNATRREAGLQLLQRRIDRVLRWQAYRDSMRQTAPLAAT